jgi:hypothetical protein
VPPVGGAGKGGDMSELGRLEFVEALLVGFAAYAECSCGCGMETYVGHRPAITREHAMRLIGAVDDSHGEVDT